MTKALLVALVKLISGANVRWAGCNPEIRQRIYFANHTSHLDAVVVWASLPAAVREWVRPVAAKEYWTANGLRRFLAANVFHAVLIDRTKVTVRNNPIEFMLEGMGQRHSLIIFPEGGRSSGEEIGSFKSGIYHLAKEKPGIEMVPVHINNLNRVLPKGEFLPVPMLSCISFGAPIILEPGESKTAFLERARAAICKLRPS
ncbi:MAG: 1-acyl-sn-glycerol-3-phosphate acyltransferase [Pedosphaera sp.]|nr:1-acyl-sn-glycerol-3-phosphate acyltransferase [Pedosphaera sp.]